MTLVPLALAALLLAEVPQTWTVAPGDTCANIALRVYGDEKRYDILHSFNDLGPLPHNLKPGLVLRLRAAEVEPVGPEATLTSFKPAVRTRHLQTWRPAETGMGLFNLDEVNTLRGAGAEVTFRDASSLLLEENALLVIQGDAQRSAVRKLAVALADGELRVSLSRLRGGSFPVKTPGAETALSGGAEGVVAVDGSRTSRVSMFEGHAEVASKGSTVKVLGGQGTRVRLGEQPEEPRDLPAMPVVDGAGLAALWREGGAQATLSWSAAARAVEYRVQLARDTRFVARVFDGQTGGLAQQFTGLDPGRYVARVIPYDESGLQGRPSAVVPVDVVRVAGLLEESGVWVPLGAPLEVEAPADAVALVDGKPPGVLSVGRHRLEVRAGDRHLLETNIFVAPPAPAVTRTDKGLLLTFSEAVPEAPALGLRCAEQAVAVTPREAKVFFAPAVPGACVVSWQGRPVSRFDVR